MHEMSLVSCRPPAAGKPATAPRGGLARLGAARRRARGQELPHA